MQMKSTINSRVQNLINLFICVDVGKKFDNALIMERIKILFI